MGNRFGWMQSLHHPGLSASARTVVASPAGSRMPVSASSDQQLERPESVEVAIAK